MNRGRMYDHRTESQYLNNAVLYTNNAEKRTAIITEPEYRGDFVRRKRRENMSEALRRVINDYPANRINTQYSGGSFGQALLLTKLPASFHNKLYDVLQYRIGQPVCDYDECVMKIQRVKEESQIRSIVNEAKMLSLIGTSTYKDLRGSDIVPCLCYAGILFAGGHAHGIQVMTKAPGVHLADLGRLTLEQYVIVEKALVTLWYLGFAHGDLHGSNIFLDPLTEKCTLIDFGMAQVIPLKLLEDLRQYHPMQIMKHPSIAKVTLMNSWKHDRECLHKIHQFLVK